MIALKNLLQSTIAPEIKPSCDKLEKAEQMLLVWILLPIPNPLNLIILLHVNEKS